MISNQILQSTIDGLKGITKIDLAIVDAEGKVLATTFVRAEMYGQAAVNFAESPADSQVMSGCHFFKVFDEYQLEYILLAKGVGEDCFMIGRIACHEIQNLLVAYKERFDKDNFIKNLLLDNLLLVDIYNRSKKLRIDNEVRRVVFLIEAKKKDGNEMDRLRTVLGSQTRDFITAVDEKCIIVVKDVEDNDSMEALRSLAETMQSVLPDRKLVRIAFGTVVNELKEVSKSYKEARMALDVGKIFFEDEDIIAYSNLGIGRLIYQLPIPLCKMFIKEIFGTKPSEEFDEETVVTIHKFFENNLNVSETARQLYIHRNTLVYRLDKLQKSTGWDLRVFDDAITFKIALMVVKYMNYMESLEY